MNSIDKAIQRSLSRFTPPELISMADWAEKKIYLSNALSSLPGNLNLDYSPHLRHILNAVDSSQYDYFTWISAVQTGKTLFEMILAAYYMAEDPSNILLFEPDATLSRSIAVERFNPMIECNPWLKKLFDAPKTKNNDEEKIYTGGYLQFCSAQSLNDLISRSARIVLLDECDSYKTDLKDRGNPIQLAKDRQIQQPRAKLFMVGTPGSETSELFQNYEKSNKCVVEYACIYCGEFQDLKFVQLKWDDPAGYGAYYQCKHCQKKMYEADKVKFFKHSRLKSNNPKPAERNHFGLWTNGLYSMSPKLTWEQIALDHVSAHRRKDKVDRKRFTNSILAEMWIDQKHKIKEDWLMKRAREYRGQAPLNCAILSCGVDIQHDRIAVSTWGWGREDHSWVIDYKEIYGDTKADPDSPHHTVWTDLDIYLNQPWQHESGREIYIRTAMVDVSDGTNQSVRKYCARRIARGILPCSGSRHVKDTDGYYGSPWHDKHSKMPIIPLNTNMIKEELYDRLTIDDAKTHGYVMFPKFLNENYYKGLLSEKKTERKDYILRCQDLGIEFPHSISLRK